MPSDQHEVEQALPGYLGNLVGKVAVTFTINAHGYRPVEAKVFVDEEMLVEDPRIVIGGAFEVAAFSVDEPDLWKPA